MNAPVKHEIPIGTILPAAEAIEKIAGMRLHSPIDIPQVPANAMPEGVSDDERAFFHAEIQRLKKEKDALILAHNYMPPDVQDAADIVGDSLYLAQQGRKSNAKILVEASVLFMNQILAVMKKPHQTILAPSLHALCSLAAHADVGSIKRWKEAHPDGQVISYVNTYWETKALSDYCCASANAPKVIRHVLKAHPGAPILFLPDIYLGLWAAKILEDEGESLDRLHLLMGACHVHEGIRPFHVALARQLHPKAAVVAHPECGCVTQCLHEMRAAPTADQMMQIRSTQGMIDYVKSVPTDEILMATEIGNAYRIEKEVPGKKVIPVSREAMCAFMKQNTLQNLYESLRDEKHVIHPDPRYVDAARLPIERMLTIV